MACTIRYTKVGETESKSYTEAEFLALLAEGELDALRKSGKIDLSDIKDFIKVVKLTRFTFKDMLIGIFQI